MTKILKNSYGELIFYSGSAIPVKTYTLKSIVCKHVFETKELTTGGLWMADNFTADICKYCGKVKNLIQTY